MSKQRLLFLAVLSIFVIVNGFAQFKAIEFYKTSESLGQALDSVNPWLSRQAFSLFRIFRFSPWYSQLYLWIFRVTYHDHNLAKERFCLDEAILPDRHTTDNSRGSDEIPQYVLDYAPLVHLYSGEQFWPCDIAEHLFHVTPNLNYIPIHLRGPDLNLTNLDRLNDWSNAHNVYLTSDDNVESRPDWLGGHKNIPTDPDEPSHSNTEDGIARSHSEESAEPSFKSMTAYGEASMSISSNPDDQTDHRSLTSKSFAQTSTNRCRHHDRNCMLQISEQTSELRTRTRKQSLGGRSHAPAVLIVVDKGNGTVDAFWFFFYSYNLGNQVFNVRFGNHVGDWEHTLVRFYHGKPQALFLSEHNFGSAYAYEAVEKVGKRPLIYSATGTHAMYTTPGSHPYILPFGILRDRTDRGPLWDPALNSYMYTYEYKSDKLQSSNFTPQAPTEWFYFAGHWGDKFYPIEDSRQYEFAGYYHYVTGPLGPRFKHLGRRKVCQGRYSDPCIIKNWLTHLNPSFLAGPGNGE